MKEKYDDFLVKYKELKSTEKGRAKIKLARYLIFIFALIIALIATGTGKENNTASKNIQKESYESKIDVTYQDKQKKLLSEDYSFVYDITGELNVKYSGTSKNGLIEGYKEDSSGIIKYKVDDGVNYEVVMGEDVVYDKLYEGLDSELFNFEILFNNLNSRMAKITNEDNKEYYYDNVDGYNYTITLDDNHITNIKIEGSSLVYNFSFNY